MNELISFLQGDVNNSVIQHYISTLGNIKLVVTTSKKLEAMNVISILQSNEAIQQGIVLTCTYYISFISSHLLYVSF